MAEWVIGGEMRHSKALFPFKSDEDRVSTLTQVIGRALDMATSKDKRVCSIVEGLRNGDKAAQEEFVHLSVQLDQPEALAVVLSLCSSAAKDGKVEDAAVMKKALLLDGVTYEFLHFASSLILGYSRISPAPTSEKNTYQNGGVVFGCSCQSLMEKMKTILCGSSEFTNAILSGLSDDKNKVDKDFMKQVRDNSSISSVAVNADEPKKFAALMGA